MMKKLSLILTFALLSPNSEVFAEDLSTQIRSGSYCRTEILNKFKLVEKSQHQNLTFKPTGELLEFAVQGEIMCPWSIQADLNGDNKEDWVGYLQNGKEFELIGYISGLRNYSVKVIETSQKPPSRHYLKRILTNNLSKLAGKKLNIGSIKYTLQVSTPDNLTDIYLWNGKDFDKIYSTYQ